ncbi:uncharacterized protein LOC144343741 [Saccoglossus kowalevskii]
MFQVERTAAKQSTELEDGSVGYQEIGGVSLGYIVRHGEPMVALAEVFTHLIDDIHDIPRTTVHKRISHLNIQKYLSTVDELRKLKALDALPSHTAMCTLIRRRDAERLYLSCRNEPTLRSKKKKNSSMAKIKPKRTTLTHSLCSQNLQYVLDIHKSSWARNSLSYCDSKASGETSSSCRVQNSWVIKPSKLTAFSSLSGPAFPTNGHHQEAPSFERLRNGGNEFPAPMFGTEMVSSESEKQVTTVHNSVTAITGTEPNSMELTNNGASVRSVATNTLSNMATKTVATSLGSQPLNPKFVFFKSGAKSTKTEEVRFVNGFQYGNGIQLKNRDDIGSEESDSDISTLEIDSNISSISTLASSNSDSSSYCSLYCSDSSPESSDTDSETSCSSSCSDSDTSVKLSRYRTLSPPQQFLQKGNSKVTNYDTSNSSLLDTQQKSAVLFKIPERDKNCIKNKVKSNHCLNIGINQGLGKRSPKSAISPTTNSLILKKREQKWTVETCSVAKTEALTEICTAPLKNTSSNLTSHIDLSPRRRKRISGEKTKAERLKLSQSKLNKQSEPTQNVCCERDTSNVNTRKRKKIKKKGATKFNGEISSTASLKHCKKEIPPRKKKKLGIVPSSKQTSVQVFSGKSRKKKKCNADERRDTLSERQFEDTSDFNDNVIKHGRKDKGTYAKEDGRHKIKISSKKQFVRREPTRKDKTTIRGDYDPADVCTPKKRKVTSMTPGRNPFKFLVNFPVVPSLVVRNGDLHPAVTMKVDSKHPPSKGHPIWKWRLGGVPLPRPATPHGKCVGRHVLD